MEPEAPPDPAFARTVCSPSTGAGRRCAVPVALAALLFLTAAAAPPAALPEVIPSPRIVVLKARRQLLLYSGDALLKTYRVGLGLDPVSPKRRSGDRATPEGSYVVCLRNPQSEFLLSLGLTYPNLADARRGLKSGLVTREQFERIRRAARLSTCPPWDTDLGGEIFIHGRGSASDWTWGCVALDDADIEELYPRIPLGTPVLIRP